MNPGLVALGDQVQALIVSSGLNIKAFVISEAETVEYRSPYGRAALVEALRGAADELEKDL